MNRQDHELVAHDPWLRRLARRLARSRTRADDLVQDTYITALRNAPPDVQLRPWLHSVMRKLAWGQVRSEQRRARREEGFSFTAPMLTLPDVLPDHGIDREQLTRALATLPEPFRSTIAQRFLHGCSCAEIARRENIPAGTVRWRQARGLELLRAELTPPRRRFAIWALPFLGAGQQLVARAWQSVVARVSRSKALWLLLACAAVIYAIVGGNSPRGSVATSPAGRRAGASLAEVSPMFTAGLAAAADARRPALAGDPARGTPDDLLATAVADRAAPTDPEASRAALEDALHIQHDDCTWDPVHGRRCTGASGTPSADPACVLIRQQLLAGNALALGSPTGRAMLAAAMQAKRALAERLGCLYEQAGPGGPPGGVRPADRSKPADGEVPADDSTPQPDSPPTVNGGCTTERNAQGLECEVCPGLPPVCRAPECHLQTLISGALCTVCTDGAGTRTTDCPAGQVATCRSEIVSGFLCSSCDGQAGPPECLPAECTVQERGCLRCVDPKDRMAMDCSIDFSAFRPSGFNGEWKSMSACDALSGIPNVSGMTCHYPGTGSCTVTDWEFGRCLSCNLRDGATSRTCVSSNEPLPDPFEDRPSDFPAPDHCVTERALDGTVGCATCTRADLSTTRSCR